MKTKLLKRLRREARRKYRYTLLINDDYYVRFMGDNYAMWIIEERKKYILRRVAELKRKRK